MDGSDHRTNPVHLRRTPAKAVYKRSYCETKRLISAPSLSWRLTYRAAVTALAFVAVERRQVAGLVADSASRRVPDASATVGRRIVTDFCFHTREILTFGNGGPEPRPHVDDIDRGTGTATFTVTPREPGKASVKLVDTQSVSAIVRVTVNAAKIGANKIYVTNLNSNSVTTYNADGSASTPTIVAPRQQLLGLAVDVAGKIYVVNHSMKP